MRRYLIAVIAVLSLTFTSAAAAQVDQVGSYLGGSEGETFVSPTTVSGLSEPMAVDASNASSYALEANGTVKAWGNGGSGQLGNGSFASSNTAVSVAFPGGTHITSIGEARGEGYAIDSSGQAWTWGANLEGSGCVPGIKHDLPEQVPGLTGVVEVQGGENHVLWRKANGTVLGCGLNHEGQLGLGPGVGKTSTPTVIPGLESIVQISAGDKTLEALDSSGRVFMAGENTSGQIGVGSKAETVWTPTQVPLPEPATSISTGGDLPPNGTSFALTATTLYGWGYDVQGQVGDGATTSKFLPVNTGLHFVSVVSGGAFVLGLDGEGNVYSWGSNGGGALGIGSQGGKALRPMFVIGGVHSISATARNAVLLGGG